ncbi:MAG: YihY/virulence factor BrkB family protein, partial [Microbacterium sp.]
SNPLLATFAIFVGLMLWFRLMGIVLLVAAARMPLTLTDAMRRERGTPRA